MLELTEYVLLTVKNVIKLALLWQEKGRMKMAASKKKVSQTSKLMAYTPEGNRFSDKGFCNPLVNALAITYCGRS